MSEIDMILIVFLIIVFIILIVISSIFSYFFRKRNPIFDYKNKIKEVGKIEKIPKISKDNNYTLIGYHYKKEIYTSDRAKHIFICGTTGSGKTVALANYVKQACQQNYPTLIIDGKGDINNESLLFITKNFCNQYNKKLYIVNLTDIKNSCTYNPFKNANPTMCKDMLINMTSWSEEHYKLNTERFLQKVITLMALHNIPLSLKSIIQYLDEKNFVKLSMDLQKNEVITKEEHSFNIELLKISGEITKGAIARFNLLLESEMGVIFNENGIDIIEGLKENALIIFILNPLIYPETSPLMGRLIIIDSKKAVSKLFNTSNNRTFFIFDEMNVYASSVLIDLVNKSRSANVTCILSTQSLSDLKSAEDDNFKDQVIENCNNYIVLRQNSPDNCEEWANTIGTSLKADTTYQIDNNEGITKPTGMGTIKFNREYIFHPDEIKRLKTGEAFYISKDEDFKTKIKVNKPF